MKRLSEYQIDASKLKELQSDNYLEINIQDTYLGCQILKRGTVYVSQSMLGADTVRQLVLVGNQKLLILKTPSQMLFSLNAE